MPGQLILGGSIFRTTAGVLEVSTDWGATWKPVSESGLVKTAVLTASLTGIKEQTTLQTLTGLGFELGASATEVWLLKYRLVVEAANTAMDIKIGFTGPTATTTYWGGLGGGSAIAAPSWGAVGAATTPNNVAAIGTTGAYGTAAATSGLAIDVSLFGGGTAGTFQIKYAQNTSDAGELKILKGSLYEAVKVAS